MLVPFRTTVCGIEELGEHCAAGVTHVLSILDPATPEPAAFAAFSAHAKLELRFDDVIEEVPDKAVPRRQHVEEILAQACPERSGAELMGEILRIRAKAWPNLRIVEFGDALLGRDGDLIAAVPLAYRTQLERRPELQRYFIDAGRGREIEKAGRVL